MSTTFVVLSFFLACSILPSANAQEKQKTIDLSTLNMDKPSQQTAPTATSPDQNGATSPATATADPASTNPAAPTNSIPRLWTYWASAVVGSPSGNGYKSPSYGFNLGADKILKSETFRLGFFLSYLMANSDQSFSFDKTGYNELRHYKVTSTSFGGRGTLYLPSNWRIAAEAGIGFLVSQLSSVTTDAPTVGTADNGLMRNSGVDAVYSLGFQKEWLSDRLAYGVELGQMVRGSRSDDGIKQVYLQLFGRWE